MNINDDLKKYNYYNDMLSQLPIMSAKDQKLLKYKVKKYENRVQKGGGNINRLKNSNSANFREIESIINNTNNMIRNNKLMRGGETNEFDVDDSLNQLMEFVKKTDNDEIKDISDGLTNVISMFAKSSTFLENVKNVIYNINVMENSVTSGMSEAQKEYAKLDENYEILSQKVKEGENINSELQNELEETKKKLDEAKEAYKKLEEIKEIIKELGRISIVLGEKMNSVEDDDKFKKILSGDEPKESGDIEMKGGNKDGEQIPTPTVPITSPPGQTVPTTTLPIAQTVPTTIPPPASGAGDVAPPTTQRIVISGPSAYRDLSLVKKPHLSESYDLSKFQYAFHEDYYTEDLEEIISKIRSKDKDKIDENILDRSEYELINLRIVSMTQEERDEFKRKYGEYNNNVDEELKEKLENVELPKIILDNMINYKPFIYKEYRNNVMRFTGLFNRRINDIKYKINRILDDVILHLNESNIQKAIEKIEEASIYIKEIQEIMKENEKYHKYILSVLNQYRLPLLINYIISGVDNMNKPIEERDYNGDIPPFTTIIDKRSYKKRSYHPLIEMHVWNYEKNKTDGNNIIKHYEDVKLNFYKQTRINVIKDRIERRQRT